MLGAHLSSHCWNPLAVLSNCVILCNKHMTVLNAHWLQLKDIMIIWHHCSLWGYRLSGMHVRWLIVGSDLYIVLILTGVPRWIPQPGSARWFQTLSRLDDESITCGVWVESTENNCLLTSASPNQCVQLNTLASFSSPALVTMATCVSIHSHIST